MKDGYYIELKNTGEKSGVKIRRDTKKEIDIAIERYKKTKDVVYIGQVKNGKVVSS
ncbi:hypothetical protein ABHV44_05475 [Flavobacteriales bacterium DA487]